MSTRKIHSNDEQIMLTAISLAEGTTGKIEFDGLELSWNYWINPLEQVTVAVKFKIGEDYIMMLDGPVKTVLSELRAGFKIINEDGYSC